MTRVFGLLCCVRRGHSDSQSSLPEPDTPGPVTSTLAYPCPCRRVIHPNQSWAAGPRAGGAVWCRHPFPVAGRCNSSPSLVFAKHERAAQQGRPGKSRGADARRGWPKAPANHCAHRRGAISSAPPLPGQSLGDLASTSGLISRAGKIHACVGKIPGGIGPSGTVEVPVSLLFPRLGFDLFYSIPFISAVCPPCL